MQGVKSCWLLLLYNHESEFMEYELMKRTYIQIFEQRREVLLNPDNPTSHATEETATQEEDIT